MSTAGSDHVRWADAAGAYLLGALPPGERADFESHVEDCPVCRRDLDELQVGADALTEWIPPADPPPSLKARIMAIVEAEAACDHRPDRLN